MSTIRKLALLAGLALAALATTAGTATAQETEVEVVEEATHEPCDACPLHAEGEAIVTDSSSMPLSTCEDEFEGIIDANGSGELQWTPRTHREPGCNVENCASPSDHWVIRDLGELETGEEHITMLMCFHSHAIQFDIHCEVEMHIVEVPPHHYVLSLDDYPCGSEPVPFFISGQWQIEKPLVQPILELEHRNQ